MTYWHFSSNDFENCIDMLECLIRKVERQGKPNIIIEKFFREKIPVTLQMCILKCLLYDSASRPSALDMMSAVPMQ